MSAPQPLTGDELAAIKARAAHATRGPWFVAKDGITLRTRAFSPEVVDLVARALIASRDAEHIAGMDPETTLRLVAEVERLRAISARLAAGLGLALHDAHPIYGNTTGWRGGIGGAAMTQGCSITDPPPGEDWMGLTLEDPLRDFLRTFPDFDLSAAKASLAADLRAALDA